MQGSCGSVMQLPLLQEQCAKNAVLIVLCDWPQKQDVNTFLLIYLTCTHLEIIVVLLIRVAGSLSKHPNTNKMNDPWQKAYDFAVEVARKAGEVCKSCLCKPLYVFLL